MRQYKTIIIVIVWEVTMVIETGVGLALFDRLLATLGLIRENRKNKVDRTDQALYALYAAVNETKLYAIRLGSGTRRNRKIEFAIAKLWSDASIPLRTIDRDLADRCFEKSGYWLNPEIWTDLKVKRKRIKLDQVEKSLHALLMTD